MSTPTPEEGYILLPATAAEVPAFLARDDFTEEQAKRLQTLVNVVAGSERIRLKPMTAGSRIEVMHRGDWVPGTVANVHKGGLMEVETERGPVTAYAKSAQARWPQTSN